MNTKENYQQKLQAELDKWESQIDILKANAEKADADMKLQLESQLADLESKQNEAKQRLLELQNASDDAWEDMKTGLQSAWKSLGDAVENASSRFK